MALKALGGLLVATVVKYADNVLKTYATAIAIVLTFCVSCASAGTMPTIGFMQGLAMVIASIFLYSFGGKPKPAPPPPSAPPAAAEGEAAE